MTTGYTLHADHGNWLDVRDPQGNRNTVDQPAAIALIRQMVAEIKVTDGLLASSYQVLHSIPPCAAHGNECIPHAQVWIAEAATLMDEQAAWKADQDHNAPWLTAAHALCADCGIPSGHITDRLKALREHIAQLGWTVQSALDQADGDNV